MIIANLLCTVLLISVVTQMFEEPYPTIVGETFKITCISTGIYILWRRPRTNVAIIVGGDQHGACNMSGSFDQNFTYFCFPSNYTYIVVIPGAFNDQNGNGTYWTCENLLGGQKQVLHLITYPEVTLDIKPKSDFLVKQGTLLKFHCDVPIRESWQGTEIVDSFLGTVVRFIKNGNSCATTGAILNLYNVTCSLKTGRLSAELLRTSSWYDRQMITCRAQYGIGNKTKDKYIETSLVVHISDKNRLDVFPTSVAFGSGISVTLSCHINQQQAEVIWYMNATIFNKSVAAETGEKCSQSSIQDHNYEYNCNVGGRLFQMIIPPRFVTYGLNDAPWTCATPDKTESNTAVFRITGIPKITASEEIICSVPATVILICNISESLIQYVKQAVWYHKVNGQLVRTANGTWDGALFAYRIPFCTTQDTGIYTCSLETALPNLETMNKEVALSIKGSPLFLDKTSNILDGTVYLRAKYYSYSASDLPRWKFQNRTLNPGTKFSIETTEGQIKTIFYNKEVKLNGLISTLMIFEYDANDEGEYTVTVQNSLSSVSETITVIGFNNIDDPEQIQKGYSGGVLGAVAVACIISTALVAALTAYVIIKRQRFSGTAKDDASKPDHSYDELDMRSLPNVYETVQQA